MPKKVSAKKIVRAARPRTTLREERIGEILRRLDRMYPAAKCSLDFETPFQLLIATILSAQSTDARVNLVTPALFRKYPTVETLAHADPPELEQDIRTTGFFRSKTRSVMGSANAILVEHGGEVPANMEALVRLPGVGRKTANVVLGNAFGRAEGIVVDTHVARVSRRLGLTRQEDPVKIEQDLVEVVPKKKWVGFSHRVILHGREICVARKPKCSQCLLNDVCPSAREPQL